MTVRHGQPLSTDPERRLDPYVPRALLRHLAEAPDEKVRTVDATMVFADISGFTALSERLARRGREGAEELAEAIGGTLSTLLTVAYDNGGSLLKLPGDALVLLFEREGHAARACRAALGMRATLREVGRVRAGPATVTLRISQGIHSGSFHLVLVGESHREQVIVGAAASKVAHMEKAASAGQILVSAETAARIPRRCVGAQKGPGLLLATAPPEHAFEEPPFRYPALGLVASCLPEMVRAHVESGLQPSEHRNVTIAFVRLDSADQLIETEGIDVAAEAIHELVVDVQRAAATHQVCLLESDLAEGGGALMLTAGAPRIVGDDEERLLLALRQIVEKERRLAVRVGVNRGNVFAGDVGPFYRRVYSVMGDAVNLAARVAAKAPPGEIYSTAGVLERSPTTFVTRELEPFKAKGKAKPVEAWSVGPPVAGRERQAVAVHFPLVGRLPELAALRGALDDAQTGRGKLVEIVGEAGIGKSRLIDEAAGWVDSERVLSATAESFTVTTPYFIWRGLMRQVIGAGWEDTDELVLTHLGACVLDNVPELAPWIPLLALVLDVDPPSTPEVDALATEFRRAKLHETVIAFLRAMIPEPTVFAIEDGHHLDEASTDLLVAITRELDGVPWLVLVGRRDAPRFDADLPDVIQIEPGPLAPADTLVLAEAATDASPLNPHLLTLAAERSGGSPQFLRDLLRAAAQGTGDELPESIEAAAMARIDQLQPHDRTLVRRASVLGLRFHPRFLLKVLGDDVSAPDETTWRRLEPFFAVDEDGYMRFRRAVVRDAAYAGLAYRTRRRLHAAVARLWEREYAGMLDEVGGMLSLHFHLAGEHEPVWRYGRVAARRAGDRGAYAAAADLWSRVLESAHALEVPLADRIDAWEQLGEARGHAGALSEATEAFRHARRLATGDPVREASLVQREAFMHERSGRFLAAVRSARSGLRRLEGLAGAPAHAARASLITTLGAVRARQGRHAEAARLYLEAMSAAEAAGNELALARACFLFDSVLVRDGRPEEAVHSERALEIYTRVGDLERQAMVLNNLGTFRYWEGRWDEAVDLYQRAAKAGERAGDLASAAFGECNIGEVLADQGRYEEAEDWLRRARRVWRGTEDVHGVAFATALLGRLAARAGRTAEGLELLTAARGDLRRLGLPVDAALADAYHAEALLLAGKTGEALIEAERLAEQDVAPQALLWRVRGLAALHDEDAATAEHALRTALELARAAGETYETALALRDLGELDVADAEELRVESRTLLDALGVERVPAVPVAV